MLNLELLKSPTKYIVQLLIQYCHNNILSKILIKHVIKKNQLKRSYQKQTWLVICANEVKNELNYQDIGSSLAEGHVYGLRFVVAAEKNLYLRLPAEKIRAIAVFIKKCLRPHGWSDTSFRAVAICPNQVKC